MLRYNFLKIFQIELICNIHISNIYLAMRRTYETGAFPWSVLEPADRASVAGLSGFISLVACHAGAPARRVGPGALSLAKVIGFWNCQSILHTFAGYLLHWGDLCPCWGLRVEGVTHCGLWAGQVVNFNCQKWQTCSLEKRTKHLFNLDVQISKKVEWYCLKFMIEH